MKALAKVVVDLPAMKKAKEILQLTNGMDVGKSWLKRLGDFAFTMIVLVSLVGFVAAMWSFCKPRPTSSKRS